MPEFSALRPSSKAAVRDASLRPVTAEDLVDPDGRCVAAFITADAGTQPQPASTPAMAGGVALDMTECEIVKRVGAPERVEIGTNERGERTATFTYVRGARPGIYRFTSGRLSDLERTAEPEPPARPAKKPAKRAAT